MNGAMVGGFDMLREWRKDKVMSKYTVDLICPYCQNRSVFDVVMVMGHLYVCHYCRKNINEPIKEDESGKLFRSTRP